MPFVPAQPKESLKSGNIYLKSVDKNYRRFYEKFVTEKKETDAVEDIQQVYVRISSLFHLIFETTFYCLE